MRIFVLRNIRLSMEKKRFQKLMNAAEQGDAWSMVELGVCYQNGSGVAKNMSIAVDWWKKAAMTDDERWAKDACWCLINYYLDVDTDHAERWAERLFEFGVNDGLIKVADKLCRVGDWDQPEGVQRDLGYHKGLEIYMNLFKRLEPDTDDSKRVAVLFTLSYDKMLASGNEPTEEMTKFLEEIDHLVPDDTKSDDRKLRKMMHAHPFQWLVNILVRSYRRLIYGILVLLCMSYFIRTVLNEIDRYRRGKAPYVLVVTGNGKGYWTKPTEEYVVVNTDRSKVVLKDLEDRAFYIYNCNSWPHRVYVFDKNRKGEMVPDTIMLTPHNYLKVDSFSLRRYRCGKEKY